MRRAARPAVKWHSRAKAGEWETSVASKRYPTRRKDAARRQAFASKSGECDDYIVSQTLT